MLLHRTKIKILWGVKDYIDSNGNKEITSLHTKCIFRMFCSGASHIDLYWNVSSNLQYRDTILVRIQKTALAIHTIKKSQFTCTLYCDCFAL